MATQQKLLGQLRPANTTAASLYSPPVRTTTLIQTLFVSNTTNTTAKFRIFHDNDGTTYDQTTALFYDVDIAGNTTVDICSDTGTIQMSMSAGNVGVRTDTNDALTFTAYGTEITG